MINNTPNKEIYLLRDPIILPTIITPDIEEVIALENGWRKVHMKQIKKDDPFRKRLFLYNPDGMYYVDENGYYVAPEKWEIAKLNLYKQINYDNPLKSRVIDIDKIYTMKFGGSIRKFQHSGKFETSTLGYSDVPRTYAEMYGVKPKIDRNYPLDHPYNIHNAIALLNGWIKVKVRHIDLDVNKKWESTIRQKNPDDFYFVDPNTKEIIPESVFKLYLPETASDGLAEDNTRFEVQKEQNHRNLLSRDPQGLAYATIAGGAVAVPPAIPILLAGHEAGEAVDDFRNGDYLGATAHTLAAAVPYSGNIARGAYLVIGKTSPEIVTRYIAPILMGLGLSSALTASDARKLENIPVISEDLLRQGNYTLQDVHDELQRLNYILTASGNHDATLYTVEGNLNLGGTASDRNLAFDVGTAIGAHTVNAGLTGALLSPRFRSWVVKFLSNLKGLAKILGYGAAGILTQMPSILYDIYLWNQYPHESSDGEQSVGERAYILINYLNNMASDTKGYNPHAVFPSTFSEELKSNRKYPGYEVNDSIPLMINGELKSTTENLTQTEENDSAWYDQVE